MRSENLRLLSRVEILTIETRADDGWLGKFCNCNATYNATLCDSGVTADGSGSLGCGDGFRKGIEVGLPGFCDDGNFVGGDGCSGTCSTECGYLCSGGDSLQADTCSFSCGDGLLVARHEACDDGNNADGDGCSSSCSIEVGWLCTNLQCDTSSCTVICGDGMRRGWELTAQGYCDDGNRENFDGCSSTCEVECGSTCQGGSVSSADTVRSLYLRVICSSHHSCC